MQCVKCGALMEATTIDFDSRWKGQAVTFRNLPAMRCTACGHTNLAIDAGELMADFIGHKGSIGAALPAVLTVEEAAEYLRISAQTVYNLQRSGQLPGGRVGGQLRFLKSALEELLRPAVPGPGRTMT